MKGAIMKEHAHLSRRSFINAAGISMAGVLTASNHAIADEVSAAPWLPEKWDIETDVVLLGTGSAISSALRAHDLGLEVLVLEKHPYHFGGTTYFSGGAIYCPNNRYAKEAGKPEIPREDILEYMKLCAKGQYSQEVLEAFVDTMPELADYLMDECGYQFSYLDTETPYYAWYTPFFDKEPVPGTSCTLWAVPVNDLAMGRALVEYGKIALEERGIEVKYNTRGIRLVYTGEPNLENGEVVGVIAQDLSTGEEIAIKARRGVILGTGGYDHNREMVQHSLPGPIYSSIAINTNEGDGHIMALELGAELRNMNVPFRYPFIMSQGTDVYQGIDVELDNGQYASEQISKMTSSMVGKPGSIIVNKKGMRFANESSPYAQFGRGFDVFDTGFDEYINIPGYWICDKTAGEAYGLPGVSKQIFEEDNVAELSDDLPAWVTKYETLEELADDKCIDIDNLLDTVARFNGFCETGVDKDFRRGEPTFDQWTFGDQARVESGELINSCLAPLATPPYYCVEYYPGMLQTAGGVNVNGKAQALNVHGNPIPRLYVAGCTMAMPLGQGYGWAGGTITPGYVFGYIAAGELANQEPVG